MTIRRRQFLEATAAGAVAASLRDTSHGAEGDPGPNFLVIMSDEHNTSVTGCYGNRIVRTPNLDRLAAEGITFDHAYTNSPLCVPARLAFTACKYVSRTGAWDNGSWLPSDDTPSLPHRLNVSGYESLLCGKQHYDATRRYGFTEIAKIGNRSFKTGKRKRRKPDDEESKTSSRDQRFKAFHPGNDSSVLNHDRKVTEATVDFFRKRKRGEKPFMLFAGYVAPHFPLIVPERYWERYKGKVPMPVLPEGHVASQPLNYRHLRRGFGVVETDPEIVRKGRELYYGLTEWFDEEVGKVLKALAESDVADNTVVIYTTDHGE
ncbi:sulfatase-like hydrolase/transferase, partial [bacterium]|nr:sulfatase-like hydrolase/transferase [bacterium]